MFDAYHVMENWHLARLFTNLDSKWGRKKKNLTNMSKFFCGSLLIQNGSLPDGSRQKVLRIESQPKAAKAFIFHCGSFQFNNVCHLITHFSFELNMTARKQSENTTLSAANQGFQLDAICLEMEIRIKSCKQLGSKSESAS